MNTIFKEVEKILQNAKIEEYKQEAKMIVLEVSKMSMEEILISKDIQNKDLIIKTAIKRAKTKAPIQYILGYSYFMNEKYILNNSVLIPRDETELLVLEAFERLKNKDKNKKIKILEIGIGSGCISCSLAKKLKMYNFEILGIDISNDALITAIENINNLDLTKTIVVRKSDIYSKIRNSEKFDLIISNPPYIPINQKEELDKVVSNFEPEIALFTKDENGIEFYTKIIQDAKKYLNKDGFIAFELGINQAKYVKKLLQEDFKDIKIIKDFANIERVISAQI